MQRRPSCERKGGMSSEWRVIRPLTGDGAAPWLPGVFATLRHGSSHTSRRTMGNAKFLYLKLLTFVPIAACEDRLGQSSQTNAFASRDIRLLVGASEAGVGFTMNFGAEFYRFGWGKRWKRPDACEEPFGSLWRHRSCFGGQTPESKNEVKAALTTSARRGHLFLPIPARLRESKSASRSSCQCSLGLSPMHGWKRWGRFYELSTSAGTGGATALRSRLGTRYCGLATIRMN